MAIDYQQTDTATPCGVITVEDGGSQGQIPPLKTRIRFTGAA